MELGAAIITRNSVDGKYRIRWHSCLHGWNNIVDILYRQAKFCDVSLGVHGPVGIQIIKAHRFVLAHASTYFANVFENLTTHRLHAAVVMIPPIVSESTMNLLLHYIYTGEVIIPQDLIGELFKAGKILQIKGFMTTSPPGSKPFTTECPLKPVAVKPREKTATAVPKDQGKTPVTIAAMPVAISKHVPNNAQELAGPSFRVMTTIAPIAKEICDTASNRAAVEKTTTEEQPSAVVDDPNQKMESNLPKLVCSACEKACGTVEQYNSHLDVEHGSMDPPMKKLKLMEEDWSAEFYSFVLCKDK